MESNPTKVEIKTNDYGPKGPILSENHKNQNSDDQVHTHSDKISSQDHLAKQSHQSFYGSKGDHEFEQEFIRKETQHSNERVDEN